MTLVPSRLPTNSRASFNDGGRNPGDAFWLRLEWSQIHLRNRIAAEPAIQGLLGSLSTCMSAAPASKLLNPTASVEGCTSLLLPLIRPRSAPDYDRAS